MRNILFTGFPGFLGSELLPRVLQRDEAATVVCLVQSKFAPLARERAATFGARVRIVEGDITTAIRLAPEFDEIYHLAAIYDLGVARDLGMRVNVDGTRHVVDFAERCNVKRLHYVSTCYVSGRHDGEFRETDLDVGQTFNNFYEETKFLAEVEVRKRGVPATIYRPSVVVGNSETGATQKYDGPYFVIQWLMRQPRIAMLPVIGRPARYRFNCVPSDYIVNSIDKLSGAPSSAAIRCYQLADPNPLTVDETIKTLARATGRRVLRIPLPKSVAKFSIDHVPGVYALMRIPSPAIDYFVHPTTYDTSNAAADLGFAPPPLDAYAQTLVTFFAAHREIGSRAMA